MPLSVSFARLFNRTSSSESADEDVGLIGGGSIVVGVVGLFRFRVPFLLPTDKAGLDTNFN